LKITFFITDSVIQFSEKGFQFFQEMRRVFDHVVLKVTN